MVNSQQSQAFTSHFDRFWCIVTCNKDCDVDLTTFAKFASPQECCCLFLEYESEDGGHEAAADPFASG